MSTPEDDVEEDPLFDVAFTEVVGAMPPECPEFPDPPFSKSDVRKLMILSWLYGYYFNERRHS